MSELRPFALLRTGDQWVRCSFDRTYLDPDSGIVELAWTTTTVETETPAPPLGAGLAFDNECRLYHTIPEQGRVDRLLWKITDPSAPIEDQPPSFNLIEGEPSEPIGDFKSIEGGGPLNEPRGVAVDVNERLFIAETAADRILVFDLWSDRLLRRVVIPGARPTDLAAHGNDVYVVLSANREIVRMTARSGPHPFAMPAGCTEPSRIAVSCCGHIAILEKSGSGDAHVWFDEKAVPDIAAPFATDIEWESDSIIVIARRPGADFLRYEVSPGESAQLPSLRARGYDGMGIVATPEVVKSTTGDGGCDCPSHRIGYWTVNGFRNAVAARLVYERSGRVTTYRLDSENYQTVWGRLFIDACIPPGADLRISCLVLDDAGDDDPMPRVPPSNVKHITIARPDLSPPMPPAVLTPADGQVIQPLHLRESGRELPWTQPEADGHFVTYEAPINAPAGRFLWITLELRGNTRVTPRVKCLRAEHPSHDYLRRLPRTFSREPRAASFLLRYLAMFEGFLGETEARAVDRDLLLDPRSAPDECIPWLASFVGLMLDERWAAAPSPRGQSPNDARREFIREAVWLFRYRGTLPGLKKFIEIYTGTPVVIVEHYRMRGIGAAVLGDTGAAFSSSIVGVGFRVGGAVGSDTPAPLEGTVEDAFRSHAHRFTVIIPSALNEEQLDVVRNIIEVHRPAHTIFDVCTVGAGMRVGRGLMLEITSIVGPTGAFFPVQLGSSVLGRGAIIGRPHIGAIAGASRTGRDSIVG
jgi:phage tail-like protein